MKKLGKCIAVFLSITLLFSFFALTGYAAESNLQDDFDNGLMNLSTSFTYYKDGTGHLALKSFSVSENNVSPYADFYYYFDKYSNSTMRFGHRFDLSYIDNRVMIPEGHSFSFTIHNFYSAFYLGVFNDDGEFNASSIYYVDLTKLLSFSMYFYDFEGNSHLISKEMYDVFINQDDAMITIQMKSDMYDLDVHKLRLIITFDREALWGAVDGGVPTESYFTDYGQFYLCFGYESLFVELNSEDEATTGLLTSIIDYIKNIFESIKNLPSNIKSALTSLFDGLSSSISGFFDSLKTKLTNLFKGVTDGISNLYYNIAGRGEEGDPDYIPSLWQRIIDGIKGLFVPDEEYMSSYSDKWDTLLSQRLGAVYQVSDVLIGSWQNVTDVDTQKTINIPELQIPLPDNNKFVFGPYDVSIIPDGFDFLFSSIRLITSICIVVLVFNGLRRKYEEVVNR